MHQAPRGTASRRARLLATRREPRPSLRVPGRHGGDHRLACGCRSKDGGAGNTRHLRNTPTPAAPHHHVAAERQRQHTVTQGRRPIRSGTHGRERQSHHDGGSNRQKREFCRHGLFLLADRTSSEIRSSSSSHNLELSFERRACHHLEARPLEEGVHHVSQRRSARGRGAAPSGIGRSAARLPRA